MDILKQSISMSIKNIRTNKMRSFLTTLGIIIGVTAVIALITIVHGVYDSVMGQFSELGANTITVSVTGNAMKTGISDSDIENIEALKYVNGTSPSVTTTATVMYEGSKNTVTVQGRSDAYFRNTTTNLVLGRELTSLEMDGSVYTCIIDRDCAQTFFLGTNPLGQTLKLNGYTYTVVGLTDDGSDDDNSSFNSFGQSSSNAGTVIIPYRNALRMTSSGNITSLEVYVSDTRYSDAVTAAVENILSESFSNDSDSYNVTNMDSLIQSMETTENMLMAMLGGIASISLLVGGIGIMNMMLVSVSERTKEIGLRKALGAEPSRIQMQFLLESIFLSLTGGFVGVILGLIISYVASTLMSTTFEIQMSAILLGVGFSAAIGIIFGWVPARRASRLNPIDALRNSDG
ncbi:ABC transporter permease [[Bacteroides] pectinophilus]|uniref:ABC3 transporter permease protein domain-containing protein n=1 Tax=[Bacteroides] pectinophilus ATCC 43243 TaxID=483218 RepID=B7AU02_9FIRM|nr:efflux ABC transporter, permease protein [[Bacteroides] pectinophilus ATCC 43243]UWN94537.1 ABC transporter permease [[Bacteroides] pectinophilus]